MKKKAKEFFWNHRVIRHKAPRYYSADGICFMIHEVYYNEKGKADAWTEDGKAIASDTLDGLGEMLRSIRKRVLIDPVLEIKGKKLVEVKTGRVASLGRK